MSIPRGVDFEQNQLSVPNVGQIQDTRRKS